MSEWISAKDRVPEREVCVLVFVPSHQEIHTAEFCNWDDTCDDWHISYGKHTHEPLTFELNEVSHWMPLPPPPVSDIRQVKDVAKDMIEKFKGSINGLADK